MVAILARPKSQKKNEEIPHKSLAVFFFTIRHSEAIIKLPNPKQHKKKKNNPSV